MLEVIMHECELVWVITAQDMDCLTYPTGVAFLAMRSITGNVPTVKLSPPTPTLIIDVTYPPLS